MVLNEVYTGAGLSATMIPETEIALHEGNQIGTTVNSNNLLRTTKAKTTLSSGYTEGGTSLSLTDAGDFPGDGSNGGTGYINGVEFTYTSKSANTLTVADLGDDYDSGVDISGNLLKTVEWDLKGSGGSTNIDGDNLAVNSLVENIYKGCYAKLDKYNSSGVDQTSSQTLLITGNTANVISFGQSLSTTGSDLFKCTILQYGSPLYAPSTVYNTTNVLADNWLGLVNTVTPPTVEAEPKQVNLALGGTRNFGFQFKGAETLGEASIDVSLNHGAWLYYALGQMTFSATPDGSNVYSQTTNGTGGEVYFHAANYTFHRKEGDVLLPPNTDSTLANYKKWDGNKIAYTFTEANSGNLPSFALEVTNEKGNTTYTVDTTNTDHFSRIYTGCQINTLTLNFEEGQDVKATVGAVSRKAHDAPLAYIPKRNETSPSALFNYSSTDTDNNPYMFSDGTIKIYGQTMARIKSGSVSITNSLTPQRFIGNYDRTVTSAHIAGQRMYELNLNLLITDRTMWDELRKQNETTDSTIDIEFAKSDDDKINLKFDNYLTTSVDIPFPDDKGPLEVNMIVQPRTLNACTYTGKWVIQG
jgi:hypothetical protein